MTIDFSFFVIAAGVVACFYKMNTWGTMDNECSARCACRHSCVPRLRLSVGNMLKQSTRRLIFIRVFLILRSDWLQNNNLCIENNPIMYFAFVYQFWLLQQSVQKFHMLFYSFGFVKYRRNILLQAF